MDRTVFMRRCAAGPPAVVAGVADSVGLGMVRDLGREGVPVLAVGTDGDATALLSRYCLAQACADPHHHEDEFLADLLAIGASIGRRAVLFAADDDSVNAISRHKESLEEHFVVPMLAWERMRLLADKRQQMELAQRAGIETPITAFVSAADELAAAAEAVPFPAVLKSAEPMALRRRTGLKVARVESRDRLDDAYERFATCGTLLLQEVVPGRDDAVYISGTYHDAASRPMAVFTGRKLRQHPKGFGDTRAGESRWWDELADVTLQLLEAVRYHGVSDVEFKRDDRDGRLKLMEVNARHGLWGPLATAAGVNLCYIAYRDAIGRPFAAPRQRDGVRWVDLVHDGPDSVGEMLRGELGLVEWLSSFRGVRADGLLSVADPWPAVAEIGRKAGRRLKRLRGHAGGDAPQA